MIHGVDRNQGGGVESRREVIVDPPPVDQLRVPVLLHHIFSLLSLIC